jgi:hypothetical protein
MADRRTTSDGRDWRQNLALAIGVAFLLAGVVGFFVTGFDNFAGDEGEPLLGLEVNPLHNIVHLLIGAAGVVASKRRDLTKAYGLALLVGYGATFVYGLFAVNEDWDVLAINNADNGLHLASALAGAVIATISTVAAGRVRGAATATTTRSRSRSRTS